MTGHTAERWVVRGVPLALAIVAEAAWISVAAGVIELFALRDPVLSIPSIAAIVLAGVAAARLLAPRLGRRWPIVAVGLVAAGGVAGTLVHPEARSAVLAGSVDPLAILGTHPAGLVGGLAVLRGIARAAPGTGGDGLRRLLGGGIIGLSLAAAAGGMIADPFRSRFLAETFTAAILFAGSASLAVALASQEESARDTGVHWHRNPAWVALVVLLTVVGAAIIGPASGVVIPATRLFLGLGVAILFLVGLVGGWNRTTLRSFVLVLAGGGVLIVILRTLAAADDGVTPPAGGGGGAVAPPATTADTMVLALGGLLLGFLAIVGVAIAVRLWMRQVAIRADDADDVRSIDRGVPDAPRRPRRRRTSERPTDAVGAYRAVVAWLEGRPAVERAPSETPLEHARRLRRRGSGALSLELLAADYALAEFGESALTAREDARGVGRWRALRRRYAAEPRRPAKEPFKPRERPKPGEPPVSPPDPDID